MLYPVPIEGHHIHSGRTEVKNQKTERGKVFILNNRTEPVFTYMLDSVLNSLTSGYKKFSLLYVFTLTLSFVIQ